MTRCLLTVGGLLWVAVGTVIAWVLLFTVVAVLNRRSHRKGAPPWPMSPKSSI